MNASATTLALPVTAGDVIEHGPADDRQSALVLLIADDKIILDRCDDATPSVVAWVELVNPAVYSGEPFNDDGAPLALLTAA